MYTLAVRGPQFGFRVAPPRPFPRHRFSSESWVRAQRRPRSVHQVYQRAALTSTWPRFGADEIQRFYSWASLRP